MSVEGAQAWVNVPAVANAITHLPPRRLAAARCYVGFSSLLKAPRFRAVFALPRRRDIMKGQKNQPGRASLAVRASRSSPTLFRVTWLRGQDFDVGSNVMKVRRVAGDDSTCLAPSGESRVQ
jgi:hypothetical protein